MVFILSNIPKTSNSNCSFDSCALIFDTISAIMLYLSFWFSFRVLGSYTLLVFLARSGSLRWSWMKVLAC